MKQRKKSDRENHRNQKLVLKRSTKQTKCQLDGLRREKTQFIKIRNKSEDITTNSIEIKRILRKYYEQPDKLGNLDEVNKVIEKQNLQRLNHKYIDNLNTLVTTKEIKSLFKNLLTKRSSQPDSLVTSNIQRSSNPFFLRFSKQTEEHFLTHSVRPASP